MPFPRHTIVLALLPLCLATAISAARAEDPEVAHFGFDPEPGLVLIKSIETFNRQDLKGQGPTTETEIVSDIRLEFEPGEQGTWWVSLLPLRAETRINGIVRENPAQEIAVGHENRLHLDEEGRAIGGDGFEELMKKFERQLDPESFARVRKGTSVGGMRQGEMGEWNRPFEGLRGEDIAVGEVWSVLAEMQMQNGPVPLSGSLEFQGWTELDGYRALKTVYRYDADGAAYAAVEEKAKNTLNLRPEGRERYNRHNLVIEGETTWLLVPERGLVLYEKHEQTMQVPLSATPGAPRAELLQSHTFRYEPSTDES